MANFIWVTRNSSYFCKILGAFFILFFIFVPRRGFKQFSSNNPKLQACRALALLGRTTLNFFGVKISSYHNHDRYFFRNARCDNSHELFFLNENVGLRRFLAVLIGYFIFNTIPSFWTVIGTIIIIMSGVYIWLRERSIKAISRSR